jgi:2TM domain
MNNPQSLNDISASQERVEAIRNRVKLQAGFYRNLSTYVLVISGLWILNFLTVGSPDRPRPIWVWWAIWPTLGWGIGVLVHGLSVLRPTGFLSADWEERKVQELLQKSQNSKGN